MISVWPLLIGLIMGITVYSVIKASNNNAKVIKVLTFIGLGAAVLLAVFILFLLLRLFIVVAGSILSVYS